MKRCSFCGRELSDETVFCPSCGQKYAGGSTVAVSAAGAFGSSSAGAPKKESRQRKGKAIILGVLAVVLAVGIAAAVLFVRWYNSTEQKLSRALEGVWRCYIATDRYAEYTFAEDGLFSMDIIGKGSFDRDWGTGYYTIEDDVLTITYVDGDHPGETQSFKITVEGDTLAIYYDDHGKTKRMDFKKYE